VDHDFQDRKMQNIKDYLQRHRVPWHMKDRIYGYYRYMWSAKQSDHGGAASLEDLHPTLRLELKLHTNRIFLSSIRMFAHISDPYCLLDFVEKLKPLICVPDEYVISWGETLNELYIVRRGSIELTEREPGSLHLTCLDDGDVFGDRALLTPFRYRSRNLEAQSLTFSELLYLKHDEYLTVFARHPALLKSWQNKWKRLEILEGRFGWEKVKIVLQMARGVRLLRGMGKAKEFLRVSLGGEASIDDATSAEVDKGKALNSRFRSKKAKTRRVIVHPSIRRSRIHRVMLNNSTGIGQKVKSKQHDAKENFELVYPLKVENKETCVREVASATKIIEVSSAMNKEEHEDIKLN